MLDALLSLSQDSKWGSGSEGFFCFYRGNHYEAYISVSVYIPLYLTGCTAAGDTGYTQIDQDTAKEMMGMDVVFRWR